MRSRPRQLSTFPISRGLSAAYEYLSASVRNSRRCSQVRYASCSGCSSSQPVKRGAATIAVGAFAVGALKESVTKPLALHAPSPFDKVAPAGAKLDPPPPPPEERRLPPPPPPPPPPKKPPPPPPVPPPLGAVPPLPPVPPVVPLPDEPMVPTPTPVPPVPGAPWVPPVPPPVFTGFDVPSAPFGAPPTPPVPGAKAVLLNPDEAPPPPPPPTTSTVPAR